MGTQNTADGKLSGRNTEQRQLLLGIIRQTDGHLDADGIYRQARYKLPNINLSTVYRALQLFKKLGVEIG